jgi:DNA-nicking Smr family endonuclease
MTRRSRRGLSDEDRALWRMVAETARPIHPKPNTPTAPSARAEPSGPERRETAAEAIAAATRVLRPHGKPEPALGWRPPADDRPRPVGRNTPGLDGGTARRLGRGRLEPQARLDLHGMTTDRAHAALLRFVASSAQEGLRCVLVVTGKGRSEDGGAWGEGVLRRDTPRWLSVAPLAQMVVGVFEAHPKHGGGGALYVYLRRRR